MIAPCTSVKAAALKLSEAGEFIAFLLGGRAGYMTGAAINIDGGTDF